MTGPRTGHPPPLFWSHRISWVSPSPLSASMWVQSGCYATLCLVFYLDAFSCNRWVWDIRAFRDFRNSATLPTHLLTLPCISGSLSDLLSRHGCVAIPGCLTHSEFLSDYPCCLPHQPCARPVWTAADLLSSSVSLPMYISRPSPYSVVVIDEEFYRRVAQMCLLSTISERVHSWAELF